MAVWFEWEELTFSCFYSLLGDHMSTQQRHLFVKTYSWS